MCVRDDRSNFSRFTPEKDEDGSVLVQASLIVPRRSSGKTTLTPKGRSDSSRSRLICRRTNLAGRLAVPSTRVHRRSRLRPPTPGQRQIRYLRKGSDEIPRVRQSGVQSMILRLPPSGRTRQPSDARIDAAPAGSLRSRGEQSHGRRLMAGSWRTRASAVGRYDTSGRFRVMSSEARQPVVDALVEDRVRRRTRGGRVRGPVCPTRPCDPYDVGPLCDR